MLKDYRRSITDQMNKRRESEKLCNVRQGGELQKEATIEKERQEKY